MSVPPRHTSSSSRREGVQSRHISRTVRLHIIAVAGRVAYSPPPGRLEASWEDSYIICESKWWTRLCVKLPGWVKTGLRLLFINCGFGLVRDGCQTVQSNITFLRLPPSNPKMSFWGHTFGWRDRGGLLDGGGGVVHVFVSEL